jgi:hypothetical protein
LTGINSRRIFAAEIKIKEMDAKKNIPDQVAESAMRMHHYCNLVIRQSERWGTFEDFDENPAFRKKGNNILSHFKYLFTMKHLIFITLSLALTLTCGTAQAQFGFGKAVQKAAERGAKRAAEKKAEEAGERAVDKALEKPIQKAEEGIEKGANAASRGLDKAGEAIQKADSAAAADAEAAAANAIAIPEVSDTPYTPDASDFAFFAMKNGAVQVFAQKDAKGKVTSQQRNTVTSITGSKNAYAIEYQSEILDAKGKSTSDNPLIITYRVVVADGIMYLDLKGMFGAIDGLANVEAAGTAQRIPNNLKPGQTIEDASANVRIGFINCSAQMTEGKCEAEESVTTPAGTFNALKVSQKINARTMGIRTEGITNTWYVKGVGSVKTETIDNKGKVVSSTELISSSGV